MSGNDESSRPPPGGDRLSPTALAVVIKAICEVMAEGFGEVTIVIEKGRLRYVRPSPSRPVE